MKITFLYWGYENPGIEHLSATLKKNGHEVCLVFDPALFNTFHITNKFLCRVFDINDGLVKKVVDSKPDLIAISVLSEDYGWACIMARKIKEKCSAPIIFGGKHVTSVPEMVIQEEFVDYICVGEGDEALVELADAIQDNKNAENIKNIWLKKDGRIITNPLRPLISDLDSLPFADKDLFYNEYKGFSYIYTISSSRGCLHACAYCHNNLMRKVYKGLGQYVRRRSVDNVIEELAAAKRKYSIKRIYFLDEIFIYDINWLKDFAGKYKEQIGLPFGCEVYPSFINEDVIDLLEFAGCRAVDMGVQTISEDIRRRILARRGNNEEIKRSIQLFRKSKIFIYLGLILGLPGQDEKEILGMAEFFNTYKPDLILTSWLRYYPRTDIIDIALRDNMITYRDIERIESGKDFAPFVREGHTFNRKLGKIANLILISPFIPKSMLKFIIKNRVYRFFPSSTFFHLNLNSLIVTWYKRLFERREKLLYFTVFGQLKFIACYMVRRFKSKRFIS